jgi:hypothetical protein
MDVDTSARRYARATTTGPPTHGPHRMPAHAEQRFVACSHRVQRADPAGRRHAGRRRACSQYRSRPPSAARLLVLLRRCRHDHRRRLRRAVERPAMPVCWLADGPWRRCQRPTAVAAGDCKHRGCAEPGKRVAWIAQLTPAGRTSAPSPKATEAQSRRGVEFEAMIETRGASRRIARLVSFPLSSRATPIRGSGGAEQ